MVRSGAAVVLLALALLGFDLEGSESRSHAARDAFMRGHPCPATGKPHGPCPGYQIDYVVPLKCYGTDLPENMQWLTVDAYKAKSREEANWCDWSSKR